MDKRIAVLAVIVCVAVAAAAIVYVAKSRQPSQTAQAGSEFNSVNDQLNDLGTFLNFENQTFDFNLGDISGGWS